MCRSTLAIIVGVDPSRILLLDKIITINQSLLHSVLTEYVNYYNTDRPHQGIDQNTPIPKLPECRDGPIRRKDVLGGIIHSYYRKAA